MINFLSGFYLESPIEYCIYIKGASITKIWPQKLILCSKIPKPIFSGFSSFLWSKSESRKLAVHLWGLYLGLRVYYWFSGKITRTEFSSHNYRFRRI